MNSTSTFNQTASVIADGALLIWWGMAILIDPVTIGVAAIGSGLIFLAVNAARLLKGIPTKGSTTAIGIIAIVWGGLTQVFALHFWASCAALLIVAGLAIIMSAVRDTKTPEATP
jgi:hypothetical protein